MPDAEAPANIGACAHKALQPAQRDGGGRGRARLTRGRPGCVQARMASRSRHTSPRGWWRTAAAPRRTRSARRRRPRCPAPLTPALTAPAWVRADAAGAGRQACAPLMKLFSECTKEHGMWAVVWRCRAENRAMNECLRDECAAPPIRPPLRETSRPRELALTARVRAGWASCTRTGAPSGSTAHNLIHSHTRTPSPSR